MISVVTGRNGMSGMTKKVGKGEVKEVVAFAKLFDPE